MREAGCVVTRRITSGRYSSGLTSHAWHVDISE